MNARLARTNTQPLLILKSPKDTEKEEKMVVPIKKYAFLSLMVVPLFGCNGSPPTTESTGTFVSPTSVSDNASNVISTPTIEGSGQDTGTQIDGSEVQPTPPIVMPVADTTCLPFAPMRKAGGETGPYISDCSAIRAVRSLSSEQDWKFFFDDASTNLDVRFGATRTEGAAYLKQIEFDRTAPGYERNLMSVSDVAHRFSQKDFDDSTWSSVKLPHTWNRYGMYCRTDTRHSAVVAGQTVYAASRQVPECNDKVNAPEQRKQGQGWYRLEFDQEIANDDTRSFLEFDGVGNVADVWLNGSYLGRHNGAFSRFRFDVTETIKATGNILAVRADNTLRIKSDTKGDGSWDKESRYVDNPTSYVLPLSGDFTVNGGIYRNVSLIQTRNKTHFEVDVTYGGPSVYVSSSPKIAISGKHEAVVAVKAEIANGTAADVSMRVRVSDMEGKQPRIISVNTPGYKIASDLAGVVTDGTIDGDVATVTFNLADVKLWDGVIDPYLYRVTVDLLDPDGEVLDSVTQPMGIRSLRHENAPARRETGAFVLNGQTRPVYGVSRHQDTLDKSWALTAADHDLDMAIIREMGANAVRFAHYQHDPRWFQLADTYGLMVWAEIPYIDGACVRGGAIDERVKYNAKYQLQELIRQNYNSPSVMWWGTSNEITRSNGGTCDVPDAELNRELDRVVAQLNTELNLLADRVGTTRASVIASMKDDKILQDVSDEVAYNHYPGWYSNGGWHNWINSFAKVRIQKRGRAIGISEYGSGGSYFQHTDASGRVARDLSFAEPPVSPFNSDWAAGDQWHPIENQTYLHQTAWGTISSNLCGMPKKDCNIWGSFIWNMFDFASYIRAEGGATNINDKGLVTFDRKIRKDAFYFYKSAWNKTEKFVHLASKDYVNRDKADGRDADGKFRIEVFSNIGELPENLKLEIVKTGDSTVSIPAQKGQKCELMGLTPERIDGTKPAITLDNVCVWNDLEFKPGEYSIRVYADVAGEAFEQKAVWNFLN
jgi:beta-galactosidase